MKKPKPKSKVVAPKANRFDVTDKDQQAGERGYDNGGQFGIGMIGRKKGGDTYPQKVSKSE